MKKLIIYPTEEINEKYAVPAGTEEIGGNSFCENKYLKIIILPAGVKYIAQYNFSGCANLETLYTPDTMEKIYLKAFICCDSLKYVFSGYRGGMGRN